MMRRPVKRSLYLYLCANAMWVKNRTPKRPRKMGEVIPYIMAMPIGERI